MVEISKQLSSFTVFPDSFGPDLQKRLCLGVHTVPLGKLSGHALTSEARHSPHRSSDQTSSSNTRMCVFFGLVMGQQRWRTSGRPKAKGLCVRASACSGTCTTRRVIFTLQRRLDTQHAHEVPGLFSPDSTAAEMDCVQLSQWPARQRWLGTCNSKRKVAEHCKGEHL